MVKDTASLSGSQIGKCKGGQSKSRTDAYSRMSVPSKASSASGDDRATVVKSFCRYLLEFLFTQVGVGGLVVCYTVCGAIAFQAIEITDETDDHILKVSARRTAAVSEVWNITNTYNTLNRKLWFNRTHVAIASYQREIIDLVLAGYDGHTVAERWTFPSALMFALSVITTIGYGNIVPRTQYGKIATMLYAVLGIPVYILYFKNMGKVFANVLKWIYRQIYFWTIRRKNVQSYAVMGKEIEEVDKLENIEEVLVPSTVCIWVMVVYLIIGTIMFSEWEGWNYLDSAYFCVTSLLKIGFGDFVPGTSAYGEVSNTKLYIDYLYLLFGMGVVAMNFYLLKEEVMLRVNKVRKKIRETSAKVKCAIRRRA